MVVTVLACKTEPRPVEVSKIVSEVIQKYDDRLDYIIGEQLELEVLADGFNWSEGPVWVAKKEGYLLFSDVPEDKIFRWSAADGAQLYLEPSGFTGAGTYSREEGSNGLILDHNGDLLLCQHGNRIVARMQAPLDAPAPRFDTLAATWEGKRFNSPNDLCRSKEGTIYFTDPPYGLPQQARDTLREIGFFGVYRLDPDGSVTVIDSTLTRPNGIILSPDEKTLYVANSDPKRAVWFRYRIGADGSVDQRRLFYDATMLAGKENEPGLPDGMAIDPQGNLFATGPGGVWIFAPDGTALGKIRTGRATANVTFDDDHRYLYITADDQLQRVAMPQR